MIVMAIDDLPLHENAPIPTWFRVGGRADRLARPASIDQLRRCLESAPDLLVLGDGANLLVADEGVGNLVVELSAEAFCQRGEAAEDEDSPGTVLVRVGAGVRLPRLINQTIAAGLSGLEGLAGVPASLGGAVVMNAGGRFGDMSEVVESITGVTRQGEVVTLSRDAIGFGYRHTGLEGLIVTDVRLRLKPGRTADLKRTRDEVMRLKVASQPLSAKSAGCCFKNPVLTVSIDGVGEAGQRVSAGLLIDRAGCKGLTLGRASVSERHANFIVAEPEAPAADVLALMDEIAGHVDAAFGVRLEREVVVWGRDGARSRLRAAADGTMS